MTAPGSQAQEFQELATDYWQLATIFMIKLKQIDEYRWEIPREGAEDDPGG